MTAIKEIQKLIPHRPPFLWVDKIVSCENRSIFTEKTIPEDLDIFKGHYPNSPLMPGVLLCEAIFQSGALLMAKTDFPGTIQSDGVPVLTRIGSAKFKRTVLPGDTLQIKAEIKEFISNVCFLKGSIRVNQKVAVQVEFACSFISNTEQGNP